MTEEKIKLCLQIISGRKSRTEMTQEEFATLFNNRKYLKTHTFPHQNEILDHAINEISNLLTKATWKI